MTITVKFIGAFRHFSGANELELGFKDLKSISDLIAMLIREMPEIESSLIDQHIERLNPNTLILVNDKEIGVLDGVESKLNDGDEVVFVPVVHGG
jgi:MoaD family protein